MEVSRVGQGGQISKVESVNKSYSTSFTKDSANEGSGTIEIIGTKEEKINQKDLIRAVDKLNKFLEDDRTKVEYEVHDKFKDIMIKIVDMDTKEVIMEVPPKKILDMVAKMCEMVGVMVDKKA